MTRIKRDFCIFIYRNPTCWRWIYRSALYYARTNRKHFGMQRIVESARWEAPNIKTVPAYPNGDKPHYKIPNEYVAHFTRLFELKHPEYKGFFITRDIPDDFLPDAKIYKVRIIQDEFDFGDDDENDE